jgi:hypothetical protein
VDWTLGDAFQSSASSMICEEQMHSRQMQDAERPSRTGSVFIVTETVLDLTIIQWRTSTWDDTVSKAA